MRKHSIREEDEEDYDDHINHKLNDLWTEMKHRKNNLIRAIAPAYSRKTDLDPDDSYDRADRGSGMRGSDNSNNEHRRQQEYNERMALAEKEILKLRNRLAVEMQENKAKESEIEELKRRISELVNDKKTLLMEKSEREPGL